MRMKKKMKVIASITLATGLITGTASSVFASTKAVDPHYKTPTYLIENWKAPDYLKQLTSKKELVYHYLSSKRQEFKITSSAKNSFKVLKEEFDQKTKTRHFRLVQTYSNIPVYGTSQTVSLDQENNVKSFMGAVVPESEQRSIKTKPSLTAAKAVKIAKLDIEKQIGKVEHYDGDIEHELYIYPYKGKDYLAYVIKASTVDPEPSYWHYFVDAHTGTIINKFNAIDQVQGTGKNLTGEVKTFEVAKKNGYYYLADETRGNGINTVDAKHVNYILFSLLSQLFGVTGLEIREKAPTFTDPTAVDAHVNAEKVYDYYKKTFGLNSYDGKGAKIISSVHVGKEWNNAAWNGKQMIYGDGDGETFRPFSAALDVIAHELTHAVTEKTANLDYQGESGALNESMSDIMGAMVDRDDWEIGEDIYLQGEKVQGLRSLKDPASIPNPINPKEGYPDHYSKRYTGEEDNGGVHINSSINNKAAYLISEGGTHYGVTTQGVGREATEQIYYRALTKYLTATSDFSAMRQAAIQAASDLYGKDSKEVKAVEDAYQAVGVQ